MNLQRPRKMSPNFEIRRASLAQKSIVANLLELYTYDFCEFLELEIGPDGRFGYRELETYWNDPQRSAFLFHIANRPAGFALIRALRTEGHNSTVWDMTEFFILRGERRRGIATAAAHELWRRFPGRWQVRVMAANEAAYRFWLYAIRSFAGDEFTVTGFQQAGNDWHRFSFEAKPDRDQPGPVAGLTK